MSSFATPRRRHSSLFQRMEQQIKKISKKLSVAKQSYSSSATKQKKNNFSSYNSIEDRNPTSRYKEMPLPQPPRANTAFLRRRQPAHHSNNSIVYLDDPAYQQVLQSSNKVVLKLQQENSKLSHRLGKVQALCENQSYRIGYIKAQLKQSDKQLILQKQREQKQTNYLTTLLEHYKSKANKYKRLLKQNSEVSIDIESDSNL